MLQEFMKGVYVALVDACWEAFLYQGDIKTDFWVIKRRQVGKEKKLDQVQAMGTSWRQGWEAQSQSCGFGSTASEVQ